MTGARELMNAPCVFCEYNGENYWQVNTHSANCPWYSVGGYTDREESLIKVVPQQSQQIESLKKENALLEATANLLVRQK